MRHVVGVRRRRLQVRKTPFLNHFLRHFVLKMIISKTGSGQTSGSRKKGDAYPTGRPTMATVLHEAKSPMR